MLRICFKRSFEAGELNTTCKDSEFERKAKLFIAQELRNHNELSKARSLYDLACEGLKHPEQFGCASVLVIPK